MFLCVFIKQSETRAALARVFCCAPDYVACAHCVCIAGASSVRVQCPEVDGNEKLIGQMLEVKVASLSDTVGEFKERLSTVLGLAANKMKLARDGVGFLRDEFSLAHYNVDPNTVLQLGTKERARGKKN